MSISRLQDDLFKDFKEQQKFIEDQVNLFDPIAESLSRRAATRIFRKGSMLLLELFFYLLCIGTIVFAVLMHKISPFNIINDMMYDIKTRYEIGVDNFWQLTIALYCLLGIIAFLFFVLAQNMRTIRIKNDILHNAGKNMRALVGQLLKRKAAIEAIQQRHFTELPTMRTNINDIPNPGYDEA
jgi:hypothetical protein